MQPSPLYHLHVGELIASPKPAVISTVLGSCVSVCLFSKKNSVGGMNHFALPTAPGGAPSDELFRYGSSSIPSLIEEVCTMSHEEPRFLSAKLAGGACEVGGQPSQFQVGVENIKIAKEILAAYGIPVIGEDIGGTSGRKVLFHTASGRVQIANISKKVETRKIKVLIVDDSRTIRDLIARILKEDPILEIIGQASDPVEASDLLKSLKPDVITLDIHMPKMTGVEWLAQLLPKNPISVVMISSLQMQEGNEVFKALELGAVDYIQKPNFSEIPIIGPIIREKVKAAASAKVIQKTARKPLLSRQPSGELDVRTILCIGASTGGTEAIKAVMSNLPERIPPTVIVQHIPPVFSKAFAGHLNELCPFEVKEAEDGDELKISRVLIAPGGKQMKIQKTQTGFCARITDDAPVNRHKPSVDYLFNSVASVIGKKTLGVILTGMGADGAKGLLEMRKKGSRTIAQNESSSVVYGMPKAAFEIGAVEKVAPLDEIAHEILTILSSRYAA